MFGWFKKQSGSLGAAEGLAPKRQQEIDPVELGQEILDEYIRKIVVNPEKDRPLDPSTQARYEAKTRLYQLAGVLLALQDAERRNPGFAAVREHIELAVFGASADGGASLRSEVGKAAQSLHDGLIVPTASGKHSGIRWAHAWLDEIGVDWKWNPASCALIALGWVNYFIMVGDALRAFKPVALARR
jgi:hypothetical protein